MLSQNSSICKIQEKYRQEVLIIAKFKKGKSGNPSGRPKGSSNRFSTIKRAFL